MLVGDSNNGNLYRIPLNATRDGFILSGGLADLVADSVAERDQLKIGSGFNGIVDLTLGPDGAVYVVSIGSGTIYRIRAAANPTSSPTSTAMSTQTPTRTPTRTSTNTPPATSTSTPPSAGTATNTPILATVHVGDLDGSSSNLGKNWQATVTIAVHDATHSPVPNATVSGAWSDGGSGASSCLTATDGRCSVTSPSIKKKNSSVSWTVNSVNSGGHVYQPSSNHDPDGDSDGTVISVRK